MERTRSPTQVLLLSSTWINNPAVFGWILFAIDFCLRLWFGARIIRRKLPSSVAWAWLSLILFLPLFGTLLYLFFGEYRQTRRRQRRLNKAIANLDRLATQKANEPGYQSGVEGESKVLAETFRGLMGLPCQAGNDIELLPDAAHAFPFLISDIQSARECIDLEFYIWSDGGRADAFGEALISAAQRGVKCRVLVDAIGSSAFIRGEMIRKLRAGGVQVLAALPSGFWRSLFARPDLRIHRKIIVIDRAIAYTGSMNLADPKLFKIEAGVGQWVDALARIKGPAVGALYGVFASDWCAETGEKFNDMVLPTKNLTKGAQAPIQCLPSGPAVKDSAIEQAVIMSIYSAKRTLTLTTPYFVPSEAMMYALVAAARRGVVTTLIVPEKVDSRLTHYASRSFLQDLLNAGVYVCLYSEGLLHTKSITIDGEFCLFGSLNLDPRSLRINFEITLAVFDAGFTADVEALQKKYIQASTPYTQELVAAQSAADVWKGDLARLVGPLL